MSGEYELNKIFAAFGWRKEELEKWREKDSWWCCWWTKQCQDAKESELFILKDINHNILVGCVLQLASILKRSQKTKKWSYRGIQLFVKDTQGNSGLVLRIIGVPYESKQIGNREGVGNREGEALRRVTNLEANKGVYAMISGSKDVLGGVRGSMVGQGGFYESSIED